MQNSKKSSPCFFLLSSSAQFYDYSNSRLYHSNWVLLDTPLEIVANATKAVAAVLQSSGQNNLQHNAPAKNTQQAAAAMKVPAKVHIVRPNSGWNRPS